MSTVIISDCMVITRSCTVTHGRATAKVLSPNIYIAAKYPIYNYGFIRTYPRDAGGCPGVP